MSKLKIVSVNSLRFQVEDKTKLVEDGVDVNALLEYFEVENV